MNSQLSSELLQAWEPKIVTWTRQQLADSDSGHGLDHISRVVQNARVICQHEPAELEIVVLAAWLHDCVSVPKDSPLRSQASRLAAEAAQKFLNDSGFPTKLIGPIAHCIAAHSFSAGIPCQTIEAKIVQDADRLEALGAIGIARCLMTGGSLKMRLYDASEPFPVSRPAMDSQQSIDHFFAKLLGLASTMQTSQGRRMAQERTEFLKVYLRQLALEIGTPESELEAALANIEAGRVSHRA